MFPYVAPYKFAEDIPALLKKARRYRKQNRLALARKTYEDVLILDSAEIRAYNGIRKILLSQKKKEYEVIQLLKQALAKLPNNVRIEQRLYSEYFKAAIGNNKVLNKLDIEGRLLVFVKNRYESLLQQYPEKLNLQKQIDKVDKYIELDVDMSNPRTNKPLKTYKKQKQILHRGRFNGLTAQETSSHLTALTSKIFSADRAPHIREMALLNVLALRSEKRYEEARLAVKNQLAQDSSDPYFIKQFRDLSNQLNSFDDLIAFEQQNHSAKNTFWSAVALFDALMKRSEHLNQSVSPQSITLINYMTNKIKYPGMAFEVETRNIKINLQNGNFGAAKSQIMVLCQKKMGTQDPHSIDRINLLIAKYFIKSGFPENKRKVLSIAMNPKYFMNSEDELIQHVALMNQDRSFEKPIHLQKLQKSISNL